MQGTVVGIKKVKWTNEKNETITGNHLYIVMASQTDNLNGYEFYFAPNKTHSGFYTDEELERIGIYEGCNLSWEFNRYGQIIKQSIQVN